MIPETDFRQWIDRLKDAAVPDQVAAGLNIPSRGRRFFCPACQADGGRTPDLSTTATGFRCFKCGESGDALALVQLATGLDFVASAEWLGDLLNLPRPERPQDRRRATPAAKPPTRPRAAPRPSSGAAGPAVAPETSDALDAFLAACRTPEGRALEYLTGRGISAAVVDSLGVRFCGREHDAVMEALDVEFGPKVLSAAGLLSKGKKGLYPTFGPLTWRRAGFLLVPYRLNGRTVYLKARPPVDKGTAERLGLPRFLNAGGAVPAPLNVDGIADAPRVLICEGETDTMAALSRGYAAVGVPGWAAFKAPWTRYFAGKEVFLVMDADEAGRRGAADIAAKFERAGLPLPKIVDLGQGLDLNDFLQGGRK
jgi:DNA primase